MYCGFIHWRHTPVCAGGAAVDGGSRRWLHIQGRYRCLLSCGCLPTASSPSLRRQRAFGCACNVIVGGRRRCQDIRCLLASSSFSRRWRAGLRSGCGGGSRFCRCRHTRSSAGGAGWHGLHRARLGSGGCETQTVESALPPSRHKVHRPGVSRTVPLQPSRLAAHLLPRTRRRSVPLSRERGGRAFAAGRLKHRHQRRQMSAAVCSSRASASARRGGDGGCGASRSGCGGDGGGGGGGRELRRCRRSRSRSRCRNRGPSRGLGPIGS
jgi:hypothetical protein